MGQANNSSERVEPIESKMANMYMIVLALVVMTFNQVLSADHDEKTVGIGLINRPKYCEITAKRGDLVKITFNVSTGYEGAGKALDRRYEKEPLEFVLGDEQMIKGLEVGINDMCKGESRFISVPSKYAYGSHGIGTLPSRTTLYFYVTFTNLNHYQQKKQIHQTFSN